MGFDITGCTNLLAIAFAFAFCAAICGLLVGWNRRDAIMAKGKHRFTRE